MSRTTTCLPLMKEFRSYRHRQSCPAALAFLPRWGQGIPTCRFVSIRSWRASPRPPGPGCRTRADHHQRSLGRHHHRPGSGRYRHPCRHGAAIDVSIAGNRRTRTGPSSPPATPPTTNHRPSGQRGRRGHVDRQQRLDRGSGPNAHAVGHGRGQFHRRSRHPVSTKGNYSHGARPHPARAGLAARRQHRNSGQARMASTRPARARSSSDGTTIRPEHFLVLHRVQVGARVELTDSKIPTQGGGKGIEIFTPTVVALENTDVSTDQQHHRRRWHADHDRRLDIVPGWRAVYLLERQCQRHHP